MTNPRELTAAIIKRCQEVARLHRTMDPKVLRKILEEHPDAVASYIYKSRFPTPGGPEDAEIS